MTSAIFLFLIAYGLQAGVVGAAGLLIARALRPYGPIVQAQVLRTALVAILLLPLVSWWGAMPSRAPYPIPSEPIRTVILRPVVRSSRASGSTVVPAPSVAPVVAPPVPEAETPREWSLADLMVAMWGVLVLLLLAPLFVASRQLRRLTHAREAFPHPQLVELLGSVAQDWRVATPRLLESREIESPCLVGIFRPVLVLPRIPSTDRVGHLRTALLHEMAHLKHRDTAWLFLAFLVRTALWFQPVVWRLRTALARAAEEAADLVVVNAGVPTVEYAECLLHFAESANQAPPVRLAALGIAESRSEVGSRIERILEPSRRCIRRITGGMRWGIGAVGGAITLAVAGCVAIAPHVARGRSMDGTAEAKPWPATPEYLAQFQGVAGLHRSPQPMPYQSDLNGLRSAHHLTKEQRKLLGEYNSRPEFSQFGYYGAQRPTRKKLTLLQSFVNQHPGFFVAEYALAYEYRLQGDQAFFEHYYRAALEHAPSVIAVRFQTDGGAPVTGIQNTQQDLEFDRQPTDPPGMNLSTRAQFPLWTDAHGCCYLPSYDVPVTTDGMSYMNVPGSPLNGREIGELVPSVGTAVPLAGGLWVMPPRVVRSKIPLVAPGGRLGDDKQPVRMDAKPFSISWSPVPHASRYVIRIARGHHYHSAEGDSDSLSEPFGSLSLVPDVTESRATIPFDNPVFWCPPWIRFQVSIQAYAANGAYLTSSDPFVFAKRQSDPLLPLTEASIRKLLPKGMRLAALHPSQAGRKGEIVIRYRGEDKRPVQMQDELLARMSALAPFIDGVPGWTMSSVGSEFELRIPLP